VSQPRGFRYALQAVLQLRRWQLDQRQHEWAVALKAQRDADDRLQRLLDLRHAAGRAPAGEGIDPVRAQAQLAFLARLGVRIEVQTAECRSMARRCEELRRASSDALGQLKAMEEHCARRRAQHVKDQGRHQAARADQEWMAHQGGRPEPDSTT
jgi:hypothetical protein